MPARSTCVARAIVGLIAVFTIVAAAPAAHAKVDNVWGRWASSLTKREHKAEIPFVVLVSFPAMVVITPFWAVSTAFGLAFGGDEEDDE